ncbi:MAG: hypothetical protein ACNYPH_02110 [Gammaproteobacteria bacterium WSBS_2016_MAG_OTU1]
MKNMILKLLLIVNVLFLSSIAYGQEQDDPTAEGATDTVKTDAVDSASTEEEVRRRPSMPKLFFAPEQRRILEVLRQEVIPQESIEFEEFVPLVFEQETVGDVIIELEDEEVERQEDIVINAFIRNRKTNEASFWANGEQHEMSDEAGVLSRNGLVQLAADAEAGGGAITGLDGVSRARFVIKVGQQLIKNGEVDETYPVVIRKR